ncbi:MAG TPA: TraM recognition domain-containing protein [Polyangiaceae bacterium]|nr:TraM recognition domain-containing protein [Polyangiaceae bacterium]
MIDLVSIFPFTIAAICGAVLLVQLFKRLPLAGRSHLPTDEDIWQAFANLSKRTDIWQPAVRAVRDPKKPEYARLLYAGAGLGNDCVLLHKYLPVSVIAQHGFVGGAPGSGKTSRINLPLCQQWIGLQENLPLIVIDLKGDPLLFHGVREAALARGRTFKWVTLSATHPSFVFNFFSDDLFDAFSTQQVAEILLTAIGLLYGEDFGRGFYTATNRAVLFAALSINPRPRSFAELADRVIEILVKKVHVAGHIPVPLREALGLAVVLSWAANIAVLNVDHPEVAQADRDHAITMSAVLEHGEVAYFYLPRMASSISAPSLARTALYAAVIAGLSRQNRNAPKRQAMALVDEAQHITSPEIKAILEQARSLGIGTVLSCQTVEALEKENQDLWPFVRECTAFQFFLTVTGGKLAEYLTEVGGTYTYLRRSVSEQRGQYGPELSVGVSEEERFFWDANAFARVNAIPGLSIAYVKNSPEPTLFGDRPELVQTFHSLSRKRAQELEARPWPKPPGGGGVYQRTPPPPPPPTPAAITPPQVQLQNLVIQKQTRKRRKNP